MQRTKLGTKTTLALAIAGMLAISPAMAEKPSWAGGGKADRNEQRSDNRDNAKGERRDGDRDGAKSERRDNDRNSARDGEGNHRFEDRHRVAIHDYYDHEYRAGRCPPGLAKKHNGCLPPGQARKWQVGQQLPRDVVYYPVPQALVLQIGVPPAGYRYVRVASDILMMAIGTRMVVDSIQDLGRRS